MRYVYFLSGSAYIYFAAATAAAIPDQLSLAIEGWQIYVDINISSSS